MKPPVERFLKSGPLFGAFCPAWDIPKNAPRPSLSFPKTRQGYIVEKGKLREIVRRNLGSAVDLLNKALSGSGLDLLEKSLARLGRGGAVPHWYEQLKSSNVLPNLDGKTIGSVVEMLFLAVLENHTLKRTGVPKLAVNPAKGVDYPDLNLGMKSPSTNYCTSEPFFSAYERLLGSEYDCIVLLTNYQEAKTTPPLKLQILKHRYLRNTELADRNLCALATEIRPFSLALGEAHAKKVFRFLAFVNQQDWQAKWILKLLGEMTDAGKTKALLKKIKPDFDNYNVKKEREGKESLSDESLQRLLSIGAVSPLHLGIIDCADNWIVDNLKEAGRLPNDNEWERLKSGPLDGKIGMSFALQWRYNFGSLFTVSKMDDDEGEGRACCRT